MTPRVYGYVEHEGRVAVFDHPDPDAGTQIPGGGVEQGESLEDAVVREVREESGLDCEVVADLGGTSRRVWFPDRGEFTVARRFFHLRPLGDVPAEPWTWVERHASDGSGPHTFAFRWASVAEAAQALDFGFGARLGALGSGPERDAVGDVDGRAVARLVGAGYDRLATRYPAWSRRAAADNRRHRSIDRALALGAAGPALDVGCGTGELATAHLLRRDLDVIGVDLSQACVDVAAAALPDAAFLAADVTDLSLPLRHFGLVTAFNSVIHVPRERHAALFRDVRRWLRPGGLFVVNVETEGGSGAGTTEPWLDGVEMFWSGWTAGEEIALLDRAGLQLVEVVDDGSDGGPFTWLICRRPERP